jgi:hypothetical protein
VCSKRRESLRVWVNFIPGAEPCLCLYQLPWGTGKRNAASACLAIKGKRLASTHLTNLKERNYTLSSCCMHTGHY